MKYTLEEIEAACSNFKGVGIFETIKAELTKPKIEFAESEVRRSEYTHSQGVSYSNWNRDPEAKPLRFEEMSQQVRDLYDVARLLNPSTLVLDPSTLVLAKKLHDAIGAFEQHHGVSDET